MAAIAPMSKRTPLVDQQPGAFTSLAGPPVAPTPLQAPNLPQSPQTNPLPFTPTTVGAAPIATPYGTFTPPDPSQLANDKYYQFRRNEMQKGLERGAASHGTLLSGGFATKLGERLGDFAGAESDNIYRRALNDYALNRDTANQNFGTSLASYNAGTNAALDAGRLNLSGNTAVYDRNYGAARDRYGDERDAALQQSNVLNVNQQAQATYEQMMNDYRAQLDAQRQAETRRQNEETARMTGRPPVYPTSLAMPILR